MGFQTCICNHNGTCKANNLTIRRPVARLVARLVPRQFCVCCGMLCFSRLPKAVLGTRRCLESADSACSGFSFFVFVSVCCFFCCFVCVCVFVFYLCFVCFVFLFALFLLIGCSSLFLSLLAFPQCAALPLLFLFLYV